MNSSLKFLIVLIVCALHIEAKAMADFGVKDESSKQTFLEDLYSDDKNSSVNANGDSVELAFTIANSTNDVSTEAFYQQAIENLKKKNDKLAKLRLRGGYVFKPSEKSPEALKAEVTRILETLTIIDKVVNAQNIRLRKLVLTAVLAFDNSDGVDVKELIEKSLKIDGEIHTFDNKSWSVPFKIAHGRGVLKLNLSVDEAFAKREEGRTRYFPVGGIEQFRGHGPAIGSASFDPATNTTNIWSSTKGKITLEGNHMDSEELEEYYPRNFDME